MSKKKVKAYDQLKKLQARVTDKDAFRSVGAARVDERKARKSKAAKQREADAAVMKKSLVAYPSNPRVWEATKVDGGRKGDKNVHPAKARAASKAARKAKQTAARELRKAEKAEARKQAREQRQAQKAARAAERKAARKLANAQAVEWTSEMVERVLSGVQKNFELTDKQVARQRKAVEGLFSLPPRKLRNRTRKAEIRTAFMQQVKLEVEAVLAVQAEAAGQKAAESALKKAAVKATAKQVQAAKEAREQSEAAEVKEPATPKTQTIQQAKAAGKSAEQYADDAIATAKMKARNRNERMATAGAMLAPRVKVSDEPRPAPKATAGKPLTKKQNKK